uniref:uncharacterized protein LOC122584995 n=1 Tax=Erigeron canadensis TaxID=72917 RepID=UPI001CB95950|nr:uncharacterized protein LOC122584995 [Erigeron canadensis]
MAGRPTEAAVVIDLDHDDDLAFELQMQEAIDLSSSSSKGHDDEPVYKIYIKGLVGHETVMNIRMSFAGIGVAICDSTSDTNCVSKFRKSFLLEAGGGRRKTEEIVELNAFLEGLNAAVNLGFKKVHVFTDTESVYHYVTGKARPTNKKIVTLVDQLMNLIQRNFACCGPFLVTQNNIKFAYKLAQDAISSEASKWAESDSGVTLVEQCTICLEYLYSDQMFSVNKCLHRYCFSCMGKHVEAKLFQGKLPECPHEKCMSKLELQSCKTFLKPELCNIMSSRLKETSIPPEEKVYCPFSNCSALMSKTEVQERTATSSTAAQGTGMIKCINCNRLFCIKCKVPWHYNITCSAYMKSFLFKSSNEAKLKSLATKNRWRQCIKCNNMVELAKGCYHIYCRCGYEFCYTCGAEWINKKATCRCLLWDERNIIYSQKRPRR